MDHDGIRVEIIRAQIRPDDLIGPWRLRAKRASSGRCLLGQGHGVLENPALAQAYVEIDGVYQSSAPDCSDLRILFAQRSAHDNNPELPVLGPCDAGCSGSAVEAGAALRAHLG